MYSELLKAFQSNKNCSFYTDDECDKFIYGKIIALNEDEVAIQMYNTDGTCDGVIVKIVSDFFRIEYDSKYNQKMEKLIETDTFEDSVEIDGNAVFDSAIKSAINKNFIVSIELMHSGNENITGLPLSLENGICTVRQIDDYGCDDGVTSFVFNTATQITINAKYEKLLSSLMNKWYGKMNNLYIKNINKYCFLQCLLIQYNQNMYFHCVRSVYTKKTDFKIKFEIGL